MDHKEIAKILGPKFDTVATDGAVALKVLNLPEGAHILDVGTGAGTFAIYMALEGFDVLTGEPATDMSHYAGQDWAQNAEKAGVADKLRFQAFNASAMPFETGAFDGVFFFGVLHHIDENDRAAVLREALRVAKAGGPVVFFEPKKVLLEKIWVDDPGHPLAANPSDYLTDDGVHTHRLEGAFMDIYIYKKAA